MEYAIEGLFEISNYLMFYSCTHRLFYNERLVARISLPGNLKVVDFCLGDDRRYVGDYFNGKFPSNQGGKGKPGKKLENRINHQSEKSTACLKTI